MNDLQPSNILIYRADDDRFRLEVKLEDQTIWLSQKQIGELYQKSKATISEHIKHIFEDGELDENSVVRTFRTTAADGKDYDVVQAKRKIPMRMTDWIKKLAIDFKKVKILKEWRAIYRDTELGFYPDLLNQLGNLRLSMRMDSVAKNPVEWDWNPLYHVQL